MSFYRKVVEHMYDIRLNQFISSFYELYRDYGHLGEERFLAEWFDKPIIRRLMPYFPPSVIISSLTELRVRKGHLFKTYVKTYWRFCKNPRVYPARVKEALNFFGLKELEEKALKSRYRELVRKSHPDRVGKTKESHMNMVKINYYYQVLRRYLSDRCERIA